MSLSRPIWKILFIVIAGMVAILFAGILIEFVALRGTTPEITDVHGDPIPGSIASLERIPLGGAPQYVLIRGADSTKPLLLFLHGGPGMPAMFLAHTFQRDLEQSFVVVHWDRRGAGKSYAAGVDSDSLTMKQTISDMVELIEDLRRRFGPQRVFLLCHSWGTLLGMLAVREHPQYFAAYVGTGQLSADSLRRFAAQRKFLFNMAVAHKDVNLLRWLRAGGGVREEDLFRYGGEIRRATSYLPLLMAGLWATEYDIFDILNVPRGASMVSARMKDDIPVRSFDEDLSSFDIPIFFLLGRHDYTTPSLLAADYLDGLHAPRKGLVWFEYSAHFPFWEEPRTFTSALVHIQGETLRYWHGQNAVSP